VFFVGIPLACFLAIDSLGYSYNDILESLPQTHLAIEPSADNIMLILGVVIHSMLGGTNVPFVQRYLMANNELQLKKAMRDCFVLSVPFTITIIICGFVVTIISGTENNNTSFYYLIDHYLPVGIKGFVITGMLAVIMSTADSWLNTASVMLAHDILGKIFPSIGLFGAHYYQKGLPKFRLKVAMKLPCIRGYMAFCFEFL
jgi:SSS family solute:Na+ symporter